MAKDFTRIPVCAYTFSLEAGGLEFPKTKSRAIAYTQFVDTISYVLLGAFKCCPSKQAAQKVRRRNCAPSRLDHNAARGTICVYTLPLKRVIQNVGRHSHVTQMYRHFTISLPRRIYCMCALSCVEAGDPESLKTKSRGISAQKLDGQSFHIYCYMCSPSPPEAGGPEFLKTDSRATNEKTVGEQPSRTYYYMSSSSIPKQVAQNF